MNDESMTGETLVKSLRAQIHDLMRQNVEQARCIADQQRQIIELRGAVDALLQPAPSELLSANLTEQARRKTSGP